MKEVTLKQGKYNDTGITFYAIFKNEVLVGEIKSNELRDTIEAYLETDWKVVVKK